MKAIASLSLPAPTTINWKQVKVNVGLGEGLVPTCPDINIDLYMYIII